MARKDSRSSLITSWENTNLPDNNSKTITPELLRTAVTDLFDTIIGNYQTVADITALNALSLGTDFKENDIVYVTDIGEGDLKGVYQYLPQRSDGVYSWQLLIKYGNNTKLITATQATLADYISTDFTAGDLAVGYLVKLTTGQIFVLIEENGDNTGDYVEITGLLNIVEDTSPQLGGDLDANNKRILASQGDDVASANNLSLDETNDGNVYSITGTTQINLIDSSDWQNGAEIVLKFDGALTIKDNQTSSGDNKKINLAKGSDYTTVAGDVLVFRLIDNEWFEIKSTGGGSLSSPLTTKGDIWGFSTVDARLPVGTNDQVLTADSTEALGIKWADPASGGHDIYADDVLQTTRTGLNFTDFTVNDSAGDDWTEVVHEFGDESNVDNSNQVEGSVKVWDSVNSYYTDQEQEEFDEIITLIESNLDGDGQLNIYIPADYSIESVILKETTSNDAGFISLGTSASGSDIIENVELDADDVTPVSVKKRYFSENADQDLYISSTSWGSGEVEIVVVCRKSSAIVKEEVLLLDVLDETTALTVATLKTFRMPFKMKVTEVRASVTTAPTGANLQVDINESGSSILSTVIEIDAGEKTSTTATTPAVISDAEIAEDAEITIDVDQIGSSVAGAGLKVTIIGFRII